MTSNSLSLRKISFKFKWYEVNSYISGEIELLVSLLELTVTDTQIWSLLHKVKWINYNNYLVI